MQGHLGHVHPMLAVDHDSLGVPELGGHETDGSGRRDTIHLAHVEARAHEHAAVRSDGQAGAMKMAGGQLGQWPWLAHPGEAQELAERVEQDEVAARKRRD